MIRIHLENGRFYIVLSADTQKEQANYLTTLLSQHFTVTVKQHKDDITISATGDNNLLYYHLLQIQSECTTNYFTIE